MMYTFYRQLCDFLRIYWGLSVSNKKSDCFPVNLIGRISSPAIFSCADMGVNYFAPLRCELTLSAAVLFLLVFEVRSRLVLRAGPD